MNIPGAIIKIILNNINPGKLNNSFAFNNNPIKPNITNNMHIRYRLVFDSLIFDEFGKILSLSSDLLGY